MAATQDRLWDDYEAHHRAQGNKVCHMVGIPLIIAGLLGLLAIPLGQLGGVTVEASLLMLLMAGVVYLWLDVRLGLVLIAFSVLLYLGARMMPWPAFMGNLAHLLVGPLWVLNHLLPLHRSQTMNVSAKPEANR